MKYPPHLRSAVLAVAASTAVALTAAACGSNGSSGGSTAAGGPVLTIQGDTGSPSLVENFNPLVAATELHGAYLIYTPLEIPSPVDGSYTPFLATGYKFTSPTTLVYTLRSGVKWSDGKPFSAADVVFTFNLLKKFAALDSNGVWSQISSVSSAGNQVTFTFKAPNVPFAATIAQTPIVPQHIWSTISNPVKYTDTHPVGTGPFMLSKFAPTQYTLTKNPNYWAASSIAPSKVVFPAQATNQTTNQLAVSSGQFDWAYTYLPDVQKTYVDHDPAHNRYWFPPGGTIGLFLNLTKSPNNNVNFRQAISEAVDRTAVAKKAVNGYMAQASLSGLILPNLSKWLDPSLPDQGLVTQDKSAAMTDFSRAGYTLKSGKLVNAQGKQASLSIVLPNSFSDWLAAATEVKNELDADGMNVTLDLPQYAQYSSEIQAGTFDGAIGGFGGTGSPYTDFNNALNSTFAAPVNTPTANNFERFKSTSADQELATLASSTSPAAQQQATNKLEQLMYSTVPIVLLYYGGSWGLFSTKNFTGWPSAADPYTLPTNYNNALLTVVTHLKKA
jgi:peptide/nickel transport system substrate-binding protein